MDGLLSQILLTPFKTVNRIQSMQEERMPISLMRIEYVEVGLAYNRHVGSPLLGSADYLI